MKIETFKNVMIGALLVALISSFIFYNVNVKVEASPNAYYVAASYGVKGGEYDFNGDGKVDLHDIGFAAKQMTAAIVTTTDPADPLEAWGESSLIIWQYNTTFYACRNMSTLLRQDIGTNLTLMEWNAVSNLTAGGILYLKQVQWNTSLPAMSDNALVIEQYDGQIKYFSNQGKFILPQVNNGPNTTGWTQTEQGRIWYDPVNDVMQYWNGSGVVTFPSIGGGSVANGTYTLPYTYTIYKSGSTYYSENSNGGTTSSSLASTVINNALSVGSVTVFLKGNDITITSPIVIGNHTHIILDGTVTLAAGSNCNMIQNANPGTCNYDDIIEGGFWDANGASQSSGYGIYFSNTNMEPSGNRYCLYLRNTNFFNAYTNAIYVRLVNNAMWMDQVDAMGRSGGAYLYNVNDFLISHSHFEDNSGTNYALTLYGGGMGSFTDLRTDGGIFFDGMTQFTLSGFTIDNAGYTDGLILHGCRVGEISNGFIRIGGTGSTSHYAIYLYGTNCGNNSITNIYTGRFPLATSSSVWAYGVYEQDAGTNYNLYTAINAMDTTGGIHIIGAQSKQSNCLP